MRKVSAKTKQFLFFLLGTYGHYFFIGLHALISYCPPEIFSVACVIALYNVLIMYTEE